MERDANWQRIPEMRGEAEQPTPNVSDDQIRTENDKVLQRLMQEKSNAGQSPPAATTAPKPTAQAKQTAPGRCLFIRQALVNQLTV